MRMGLGLGLVGLAGPSVSAQQTALRERMAIATDYVISGDSTRDSAYNQVQAYYARMLGKAGIQARDNAQSGVSGMEWATDDAGVTATSAQCISLIPGTGSTTVWEFSFGINDVDAGATQDPQTDLFDVWKPGIDAVLTAKPDTMLFFAQPVRVANAARNAVLNAAYELLRAEYGAHVVQTYAVMNAVYDGDQAAPEDRIFYFDGTHPDYTGSIRLINKILSDILPDSLLSVIKLDHKHYTGASSDTVLQEFLSADIRAGSFWNASGTISANALWACFPIASVAFGNIVRVFHNGDRDDIRVTRGGTGADNTGATLLETRTVPDAGALPAEYSYTITNLGVDRVGATIRSNGSATVGDEYLRVVDANPAKAAGDLTQAELNAGVTMRLTL